MMRGDEKGMIRMILIDGAHGGGLVLRMSLALSILLNQAFTIRNIRASRSKPGLQAQHLAAVRLAAAYAKAHVTPIERGSMELTFTPGREREHHLEAAIPTGGSSMLAFQPLLAPFFLEPGRKRAILIGGTDVPRAPSPDYVRDVISPLLSMHGRMDVRVQRRGYLPAGGGRVEITMESQYTPVDATAHPPMEATCDEKLIMEGIILRATADARLASRSVLERLERYARMKAAEHGVTLSQQVQYVQAASPGGGMTIILQHSQGRLGESHAFIPHQPVERIARHVFTRLEEQFTLGCRVDVHAADMLLAFLPFLGGRLCSLATAHYRAGLYVLNQFLPGRVRVETREARDQQIICAHIPREERVQPSLHAKRS